MSRLSVAPGILFLTVPRALIITATNIVIGFGVIGNKVTGFLQVIRIVFDNVMWNQIKDLGLNVRPESEKTLRKYGYQRKFKNENDRNEQFSYHFDMPNASRAYLKAITHDKKIFIANIVPHLDNVTG